MAIAKITFRKDTSANWASANPVLADGEPGYDTTLKRMKVGDGVSSWAGLPFRDLAAGELAQILSAAATIDAGVDATDAALAAAIQTPGSASEQALSSTIVGVGGESFEARKRRRLRRLWEALANNSCTVVIPGDSWTEGTRGAAAPYLRYVDHLTAAIRRAMPQQYGGIYIPSNSSYLDRLPANVVYTGTPTAKDASGAGFYNVEMAVGDTATLTIAGTGFRMHMDRRTDGASVEVRIDGVLLETYNSQSGSNSYAEYRTYTGLSNGPHTIELTVTEATGTIFSLQGFYVYNGDETTGARVYPAGRGGISAKDYALKSTNWSVFSSTIPDVIIVGLGGINDYRTAVPVATFKKALEEMVAFVHARPLMADASWVFLQFPEPAIGGTPAVAPWEAYRAVVAEVCESAEGILVDLADIFTPGRLDQGSALVNSDEVHVDDPGHVAVAQKIAEAILPPAAPRRVVMQERIIVPTVDLYTASGSPTIGLVNSTFQAARLPDAATTAMVAMPTIPADWRTFDIDITYMNYSTGTGNLRWRCRVKKIAVGGSVSVANDDYKTVAAKGQFVLDQAQKMNSTAVTVADQNQRIYIEISRIGADAADTLANDVAVTEIVLRRTS